MYSIAYKVIYYIFVIFYTVFCDLRYPRYIRYLIEIFIGFADFEKKE